MSDIIALLRESTTYVGPSMSFDHDRA